MNPEPLPNRENTADGDAWDVAADILRHEPDLPDSVHLSTDIVETPIGPLFAAADPGRLYLLHQVKKFGLQRRVATLHARVDCVLREGGNVLIEEVRDQLDSYFGAARRDFTIPLFLTGTMFQNTVWNEVATIPYGAQQTYAELAARIGKPSSFRAVAQALALNPILIMVPCHRVINADGSLGGYGGGSDSKNLLITLERSNLENAPGCGKKDGDSV